QTVEATILLSGLAFENGGLSIAHSLTRGLSIVPGVAEALHGEQVAWGLLVQWVLEERTEEFLADQLAFYRRIGLPRTLRELGLQGDPAAAAATIAQDSWTRAPYVRALTQPIDPARLEAAIRMTERFAGP
ncbi:MAG: iron-containing alcohol dehydrogenase, partial [Gemmatimonadales bacterium]|nr:iron-containing alcohol dehydrogenase [Gemmatimonadales bacterium]